MLWRTRTIVRFRFLLVIEILFNKRGVAGDGIRRRFEAGGGMREVVWLRLLISMVSQLLCFCHFEEFLS